MNLLSLLFKNGAQVDKQQKYGILQGIGAYLVWGVSPVYWKLMQEAGAWEILCHRIVWSTLFLAVAVSATKRWRVLWDALRHKTTWFQFGASSALIAANWLAFIWGTNNGMVLECALGYFVLPLFNVALGMFFLKERLSRPQAIALVLSACGVAVEIWRSSGLPSVALALAVTFSLYGLIRKKAPLGPVEGLFLEAFFLTPFALLYMFYSAASGKAAFLNYGLSLDLLLISAGVVTSVPLLMFAYAVKRIKLSTLGFIQYLSPSASFVLALVVFHEAAPIARFIAFGFVWLAIAVLLFVPAAGKISQNRSRET